MSYVQKMIENPFDSHVNKWRTNNESSLENLFLQNGIIQQSFCGVVKRINRNLEALESF